ncbi:Mitochondrial translocator assembly and maintenance protein 41 [Dispira simplex]|nr:Mitochondrial translocator assembly and maintenance protein 41 [Dispira simplex]
MYHTADPNSALCHVIQHFRAPIRFAFAYGSGVFQQARKASSEKPMVDFIIAVTHPDHWHSLNIQQNPHHYSSLRYFGSTTVTRVQEKFGAGVYFNPYIELEGLRLKYGVVSLSTLCSDLVNWDTLYLAGRMHKPIMVIKNDPVIQITSQVNLTNATRLALLLLPSRFTEEELYSRIVGLSYTGDIRMKLGENPHKVRNIVRGQLDDLRMVYKEILTNMPNVVSDQRGADNIEQDNNPDTRARMIRNLPSTYYYRLTRAFQKRDPHVFTNPVIPAESEEYIEAHKHASAGMARSPHLTECTLMAIRSTVQRPALTQSLKGILTAGISKSIRYSLQKLRRSRGL